MIQVTRLALLNLFMLVSDCQPPLRPDLRRLPVFGLAFLDFAVVTVMVCKLLIGTGRTRLCVQNGNAEIGVVYDGLGQ